jgi:hypothetical protein
MRGNHHSFSLYLRIAVFFLGALTYLYGILAYLRYGSRVPQVMSSILPSGPWSITIDVTLAITALFAYAMPINPALAFAEYLVFHKCTYTNPK